MPQIPRADAESLIRLISSNILRNKELSSICQLNGLQTSGVKATLQNRIVTRKCCLRLPLRLDGRFRLPYLLSYAPSFLPCVSEVSSTA